MKKNLIISLILVMIISLTACQVKNDEKTDAIQFKEEYESLNGTKREKDGKTIRTIEIDDNNPFIYKNASDIVEMMDNKETFAVYFGFADCPWCRSVVPTLSDVAVDLGLNEIYYVDVKEIRDELEIGNDGTVITKKEGSKDYLKLLDLLDNVLENYTLTDSDGNKVETGEKRIYAPNIVSVVDGQAERMESGISSEQTDPYMELTEKIQKDTYNTFKCLLECVVKSNNSCSKTTC